MRALSVAATGMDAQQTNLEVIANNIANINTTGYKRARAEFADLLYQTERAQGVPNRANQAIVPEGANIGLGVQTAAVRNIHTQGELTHTENSLDLALVGRGWFQIQTPDGNTVYTRAGAFNQNADGQLVTIDGYTVVPNIVFPANVQSPDMLKPLAGNVYSQSNDSGVIVMGYPGNGSYGKVLSGALEDSNVDIAEELTSMIESQRNYTANSKVFQTGSELMEVLVNLKR
ncbi:flagellar hook-basal body complex protein [Rhizobium sp. LC145]|uniref:flagellar hook-basal body complex protein n=1 Tax=Rhizobium sp. LC145 TaxID=1120688 RepID=UPI00062A4C85|nr:flagellar hook-basal body complex protein [Rhizobium sp. LC145]KKX31982.1 flagellar basal-body rod protein FlgG [Rhizobium sp. LC145]